MRPVADARVGAAEVGRGGRLEPGDFRVDTVPGAPGEPATLRGTSTRTPARSSLLALADADEHDRGLQDAPWPIHFRKQPGEPKRVQPSRARKDDDD